MESAPPQHRGCRYSGGIVVLLVWETSWIRVSMAMRKAVALGQGANLRLCAAWNRSEEFARRSDWICMSWYGAPGAIRTPDLLVRSQIRSNFANLLISVTCNSFEISLPVDSC